MNLDLFNNFARDVKEHSFTLKFIDELTDYLANIKSDILKSQVSQDLADFLNTDELKSKYKILSTFMGDFYQKQNEILKEYSKDFGEDKSIYYVSWNSNVDDKYDEKNTYTIDEYTQGKIAKEIYVIRQRFV